MEKFKLDLYNYYNIPKAKRIARGVLYQYENKYETNILILPGGGYSFTSKTEWENVADAYIAQGCNAYVLDYSVCPIRYPNQLVEVCMALDYIRHQNKFPTLLLGFSAGGHLAGTVATLYNNYPMYNARPDGVILAYPVISTDKAIWHKGSFICLCGRFNSKLIATLSVDKLVSAATPPMYIWHTQEDTGVPCENSIRMSTALTLSGVANKLELFPRGGHGLNLGDDEHPEIKVWVKNSLQFFKEKNII